MKKSFLAVVLFLGFAATGYSQTAVVEEVNYNTKTVRIVDIQTGIAEEIIIGNDNLTIIPGQVVTITTVGLQKRLLIVKPSDDLSGTTTTTDNDDDNDVIGWENHDGN